MKIFISQPMRGLTNEEIAETRKKIEEACKEKFKGEEIIFVDSFIKETPPSDAKNIPLWYLGMAITKLAEADHLVGLVNGAETYSGCIMEKECARFYGIPCTFFELDVKRAL